MLASRWTLIKMLYLGLPWLAAGCSKSTVSNADVALPNVDKLVADAVEAIDGKRYSDAQALLEQAIQKNPKHAEAHFRLGLALVMQGDKTKIAMASWENALALEPKLVDAYIHLSAWKLQSQDATGALATAERGLEVAKRHPDLMEIRAWTLDALGRNAEALAAFGEVVQLRPEDCKLRIRNAQLLSQATKKSEALTQLAAIRQCADPQLLSMGAMVALDCDAPTICVALMDLGLKALKHPDLFARRGMCREKNQDLPGAIADLRQAVALDGNSAPAHHYLGLLLRTQNKVLACKELALAATQGKDSELGPAARKDREELGCK